MYIALLDINQLYCALFVQKVPMLNKFILIKFLVETKLLLNYEEKSIGVKIKRVPNNKT